ncbi:MAG TPA: carboxypeptidase-like regulatory domain-containing protein, partial [Gemmatimonadaceae bacterium]|nr:carboxypeptidase-like regulatory domain-containing protein [Gemmatimonadaceae bacterium]
MAAFTSLRNPAHRTRLLVALLAFAVVVLLAPRTAVAQDPDIIRGTVTDSSGQPIRDAQVTVTSLAAETSRTGRTDDRGRFTILFANGGGDYFVRIVSIGLQPFETRVQRIEDDPVLLVTAKLVRTPTMLDAVRVLADQRERVRQNPVGAPDVGGSEARLGAGNAILTPEQLGNLAALAATLEGVTLIPGVDGGAAGFSVLGLGAEQNSVTMNGMQADAGNLPRDAAVMTSLATTTFDASRGGFSGAQLSVRSLPASNFVQRNVSLALDHPGLQWSDPSAARSGQEYSNYSLGGSVSGPLVRDKAFYSLSAQVGRRSSDLRSILSADDVRLQRMGIAPDSLARFLGLLDQLGIPTTVSGIPSSQRADQGSLMARLDLSPSGQRTLNFTATGSWRQNSGTGIGDASLPARGGESGSWNGALQGNFSTYVNNVLNETRLGINTKADENSPYLTLPSGRVRVSSLLP